THKLVARRTQQGSNHTGLVIVIHVKPPSGPVAIPRGLGPPARRAATSLRVNPCLVLAEGHPISPTKTRSVHFAPYLLDVPGPPDCLVLKFAGPAPFIP